MAYVGTPIDTRNTFQSLQGKRFNGDGSTTAFTLDVAPSSTLDIEVFVGNVRQDPNSAYTLSGTTLTFTGAPPSGTNNIYVVHQAKSVGTIDVPDDIISGKTLVTLDNSNDHVLIEDATDGELKKALIPAASFAGIDDQSSSNDDQLTITDTAVVINEDSDDVDFRVESNGSANAITVDAGNDTVGLLSASTTQGADVQIGFHDTATTATSMGTANANDSTLLIGGLNSGATQGSLYLGGQNVSENGVCGAIYGFSGGSQNAAIEFIEGSGDAQGIISFKTAAGTGGTLGESFKILANKSIQFGGNTNLGINVTPGDAKFVIGEVFDNIAAIITNDQTSGGTGETHYFFKRENSTVGSISATNSSTSFNTSSDYRLKENVTYDWDATTRLKQLKPARFNWIADDTNTLVDGFIAHEVTAVPEAIYGTKDATETKSNVVLNSEGNMLHHNITEAEWTAGKEETPPKYPTDSTWQASKEFIIPQQIDQAKLVPLLTKALQELEARVTTLES